MRMIDAEERKGEEETNKILKSMENNSLLWGMAYFPHYFRKKSPPFHLRILYESMNNLWLAVQSPRGSAKSVIINFLKSMHSIVFSKKNFIIIIQNTYAKSAASLGNIKLEFRDNKKLRTDFGIMMIKDAEGDTIFKKLDGSLTRGLCKGADQLGSIRGERFGAYRPDLIIIDDIEDDEMVRNSERRFELEKQFNEVLNYAGESGDTQIIFIGTILHDDSLMAKLVSADNYKRFKKLFYKARYDIDGMKRSVWEDKWSVEDLDDMEREDPSGFAKEMQGDPSSGLLEGIHREDFRYWKIEERYAVLLSSDYTVVSRWALSDCKAAIAYDLAWEEKRDSDFGVIFPAFITPGADILYDDYFVKRGLRPEEFEETCFAMNDRLERLTGKRVVNGFEKAKLEKVMKWWLGEAMRRRNKFLWLKDLQWDGDKIQRILTRLGNRYSQHVIYHKKGMGDLENQLIRIRSTPHDDIADAAQGVVQLLQYAPSRKKEAVKETSFNWWRKQTPVWRDKNRRDYVFGKKEKPDFLNTKPAIYVPA